MNCRLIFAVSLCLIVGFGGYVSAQRGISRQSGSTSRTSGSASQMAVTQILRSLDSNRNGLLDLTEANGRTREFVRRAGLDPKQTHSIASIAKALNSSKNKDANGKAAGKSIGESARKVPGFGVEVERFGVKDFSPSGEERMSCLLYTSDAADEG